ncbi:MAG: hypothetical protein PHX87_03320 [Candidatus Peribacteraceae bacterium]|nr:hypothetical protein [Candidatus Peribacteraceae bacterium]MDD5742438.1 hypothetical protein [Candidatus Peribacteraceae bacterium]
MKTRTITVSLPAEPPEGGDPLRDFLYFDTMRVLLKHLRLDPENPAHVERRGTQTLIFHLSAENDCCIRMQYLLESFRALFGFTVTMT